METQALLDLLVIQGFWVQKGKKACQVSLEYQEFQVSVENLDKWAIMVYKAKKGREGALVYLVLLECLAAVLMLATCW